MIIKNGLVFTEEGTFENQDLYVENDKIVVNGEVEVLDVEGCYVIPGLTDIHFHGCVGYDFCDGTYEAIAKMAEFQLRNGVTTICPASMTFSEEQLTEIFRNAANYKNDEGAALVGINMEGPYISMEKKGAQNGEYIHKPDADMFFRLQEAANGLIKLCDIAPEVDGAMECIEKIAKNVRVSVAHSAADFDIAEEAFQKGAKHVTHLYNAMPPFSHRAPGVIGAACDNENVMVELITDGIHSHPSTVRTTFKMFGDDRVVLISDSMMACGLEDGQYTLGGQDVTVKGNLATLTELGNIAGSVTNLMACMKRAVKEMRIPLESAVKCATMNPAKAIGIFDKYGSLVPGKQADVVVLDKDLEIKYVMKAGKVVYGYDEN